jgi:hypothetical protein
MHLKMKLWLREIIKVDVDMDGIFCFTFTFNLIHHLHFADLWRAAALIAGAVLALGIRYSLQKAVIFWKHTSDLSGSAVCYLLIYTLAGPFIYMCILLPFGFHETSLPCFHHTLHLPRTALCVQNICVGSFSFNLLFINVVYLLQAENKI